MPFKRTSDKPLYLALTSDEISDLRRGFGLRSTVAKVDTYTGRAHVLRGHYSAAAAAAAHASPEEAVFHGGILFRNSSNALIFLSYRCEVFSCAC